MTGPHRIRIALLVLWALLGAFSFAFGRTDGLVYDDPAIPIAHVTELQSSGSNDGICIGIGAVLSGAALLWSALRIRRPFGGTDVVVHAALTAIQLLYLLGIEAGSLWQTILRDRNWALVAWLATLISLVGCVVLAAVTVSAARATEGTGATAS